MLLGNGNFIFANPGQYCGTYQSVQRANVGNTGMKLNRFLGGFSPLASMPLSRDGENSIDMSRTTDGIGCLNINGCIVDASLCATFNVMINTVTGQALSNANLLGFVFYEYPNMISQVYGSCTVNGVGNAMLGAQTVTVSDCLINATLAGTFSMAHVDGAIVTTGTLMDMTPDDLAKTIFALPIVGNDAIGTMG